MPKPINNADAAQALTTAYALKGRVQLQLDEMVVPVTIVDDIQPRTEVRACGAGFTETAVAAEFSYVGCQTVAGLALHVEKIIINNPSGSSNDFRVVLLSEAELATIGITPASLLVKDIPISGSVVASTVWGGTDGSQRGFDLGSVRLAPNSILILPIDVTLYQPNPLRAAVAIQSSVVNRTVVVTMFCQERTLA